MADNEYHNNHAPKNKVSNLKQNLDRDVSRIKNQVLKSRANLKQLLPKPLETFPASGNPSHIEFTEKEIKILENMIYMLLLTLLLSTVNLHNLPEDIRKLASDIFSDKSQISLIEKGSGMSQPNFSGGGNGDNQENSVLKDDDENSESSLTDSPPDSTTFDQIIEFVNTIPDVINVPHGDSVSILGIETPANITITFNIPPQNEIVNVGDKIKFVANDLPDEYAYEISVRNLLDPTQNRVISKIMRIHGGPIIDSVSPTNTIPVIRDISNQISPFTVDYKYDVYKTGVVFSSFKNKNLNFVYENTGSFSSSTSEHKFLNLGDYGTIKIRSFYNSYNVPSDTTTVEWKVLPPGDQPFNYALKDSVFWHSSLGWVRKKGSNDWVITTKPTIVIEGQTDSLNGRFVVNRDTFNLNNLEHFQKFDINYSFTNNSDIIFIAENEQGTKKDSTIIKVILADTNNVTGVKENENKLFFDSKNIKVSPPFPNETRDGKFQIQLAVNAMNENIGEITVKSEIFDLNGQFIKRVEQPISANQEQNIDFNISDCSSGVYLVQLTISSGKNEYRVMRKIMYVK